MDYKSIYDVKIKGKTVFIRADLNSSVVEGRPVVSARIREHAKSLYYLSEEGARVVVLSHQGRKGEPEFIPLNRHAGMIRKLIGKKLIFVKWDEDYKKKIKELKNGEIILLDNTRFLDIEQAKGKSAEDFSKEEPIKSLASVGDIFVQDALSICHRKQATVIGFSPLLPSYVGPVLQKELEALEKLEEVKDSKIAVLGGAKPEDSIELLKSMLEKGTVDKVLLGGLFGELFLKAKGIDFGKKEEYFKKKGYGQLIPLIKEVYEKYKEKIILPVDLAVNEGGDRKEIKVEDLPSKYSTMDIGWNTVELFKPKIRAAALTIFNGPMGVYEKKEFSLGTKKILEAVAFCRTYSLLGGGDTERALTTLGLLPQDFSHVSLAGKALLSYLAGEKLPGLEVLKQKR